MNQDTRIETVRVKFDNEQGFCIINKEDFNDAKHELFDAPEPEPQQDVGKGQPSWAPQ